MMKRLNIDSVRAGREPGAELTDLTMNSAGAETRVSPAPKPILKWAGGKARLLPRILHAPARAIDTYYEPFAGGAAVFFSLAHSQRFKRAVLSDRNRELVDVYRAVKTKVEPLLALLGTYSHNPDEYYRIRALDPSQLDLLERAARVIYLNRTGYNGLYRVNRSGQFNVPFGRYKDPKFCDPPRLRAASAMLKRVRLEVGDFEKILHASSQGRCDLFRSPPTFPCRKRRILPPTTVKASLWPITRGWQKRCPASGGSGCLSRAVQLIDPNYPRPLSAV